MRCNLIPDAEFHSVTEIQPEWLTGRDIRVVALDMDNTLARYSESEPADDVLAWLRSVRQSGIFTVLVSNTRNIKRVKIMCEKLGLEYFRHRARKPSPLAFLWPTEVFNVQPQQIAAIGDQVFTDVLGANRAGCLSVIVYPRGMDENPLFRLRRFIEKPFIRKAAYRHEE